MDLISKSEGLTHICESIFHHLDHKTLLSCQLVNSNFKRILDNPLFWMKILKRDNRTNERLPELEIIATFIGHYGLKKLGLELASIAKHIGHYKHEYIRQKNHRYSKHLSTKLLDCLGSNSMCKKLMEDHEESFTRSLMKFHQILNKENKTLLKSMTIGEFAASFGSMEFIRLLKSLNRLRKSNYLFNAAYFGNLEAVKYFYHKNGYCWPLRNGRTPIHMASERGHLKIVRFFIQNGRNPNPRCEKGMTPLYLASKYGNLDVVKYLINHIYKKQILRKDFIHGFSPIHVAVINGHLEILKILAIFTDNPNAKCKSNKLTPIHIAAYYNHLEILKFLVPLVKDPFIPNSRGWNALDIAGQKGHSEIVKYLTSVNEGLKSNLYSNMFPVCVEQQQNKPEENYFFYYLSFMILFVSIVLALLNQYFLDN